jgi:hypothetical protein
VPGDPMVRCHADPGDELLAPIAYALRVWSLRLSPQLTVR